uniref:Transmembrane protein n=1 Tax=uncultured marine virus TaxID=186617 RepID=A0A0F7L0P6_9VIRU|nr:hypothetical protein [uncultured marine virus]
MRPDWRAASKAISAVFERNDWSTSLPLSWRLRESDRDIKLSKYSATVSAITPGFLCFVLNCSPVMVFFVAVLMATVRLRFASCAAFRSFRAPLKSALSLSTFSIISCAVISFIPA